MKNIFNFLFFLLVTILICSIPSNAQWVQTNGPYGGGVNCFIAKGGNLFAGAAGGGVYISTDYGSHWSSKNNGLPNGCFVKGFLLSGTDIYAGLWGKGIYRSRNNGLSWSKRDNGLTNYTIYCSTSINDTNLFVGTEGGVFRSTDEGANWIWLSSGWPPFPDVRALASNNEKIFAATWFGKIYRSTNNGTNWTDVTSGLNGSFTALTISDTNTFVGNYSGRVYRSTNNGASWTEVSSGLTLGNPIINFAVVGSNVFAVTRAAVYISTNNGDSWNLSSDGLPTASWLNSIGINPNGAAGTDLFVSSSYSLHSVYRSTNNGSSWTSSDSGLISTGVGALAVNNSYIFAGAGGTGIFRSPNNGEDWIAINNGMTDTRISDIAVKDTFIFAGTWGGGVFRSTDDGSNWTPANQGLNNQVLSLEVQGQNIFAGTYGSGIFRSTDNGSNWIPVNNGFPSGGVVFAIAASNEYIFAGSFVAAGVGGVYRSTDNGNSWTQVVNGLTDSRISALEFAGTNLFAGTLDAFGAGGSGIYRTTDYGANWTQVNNGLTNLTINALYSVNKTNIFAGTGEGGTGGVSNAGIFLSTDNGSNWVQINTGLWNTVVSSFVVSGDNLFIGAEGGGVWKRPLSEIIPTTTFQLSVSVANGWNMVSIPGLHPTDQNVDTWWAFRDPGANVFRYAGGYQAITTATPGTGYWMKHTGDRTYNTGDEWPAGGIQMVPHDPIAGASGWNLFGGYELSVTAANVTTNPPGLQNGPIYRYSGGYAVATTLEPGYGYWIKLNAAGQIIIPETMAKGEVVEYFPKEWGRIILTDATGISYTLYAVKGEVNLNDYELPPAPPTGMLDIRFSSGRIAEDINGSIKTIDMSGITYPLTVRVEGMDIRLMEETGKAINTNLKSGEDIVISDAMIQKLMVTGELIPAQYALEQNYPNPFNPSTTIKFSLATESKVSLKVFDALGQEVAELLNEAMSGGIKRIIFDASNLSSGIYLYKIIATGNDGSNFTAVKKMILIK